MNQTNRNNRPRKNRNRAQTSAQPDHLDALLLGALPSNAYILLRAYHLEMRDTCCAPAMTMTESLGLLESLPGWAMLTKVATRLHRAMTE